MIKKLNGRPVRQQTAGGTTWVGPHHHHYHRHCALKEGQHLQTHPFQSKISMILKPKSGKKPTQILKKMTSNTLKADRAIHRVAFNPNRASSAEVLRVPVPKPNNRDVLVPGSFSLIFDSAVSGHANSYIVNNGKRRNLIRGIKVVTQVKTFDKVIYIRFIAIFKRNFDKCESKTCSARTEIKI